MNFLHPRFLFCGFFSSNPFLIGPRRYIKLTLFRTNENYGAYNFGLGCFVLLHFLGTNWSP